MAEALGKSVDFDGATYSIQVKDKSTSKSGIDMDSVKEIYLFGGKDFCNNKNKDLDQSKIVSRASIDYFKDSMLAANNLIVISVADSKYDLLPEIIKQKIDVNKYTTDTILNINNATVVFR